MSKDKKDGNWFKRHKILTAILAIVLIGIIASAAGGGGKKNNTNANSQSTNSSSKTQATISKVGTAVRDGKFEFTVSSIKCNVPSVSDSTGYLTKDAQGQYCLLNVDVKNIGNEAQSLTADAQKLLDASGKQYSADDVATLYETPDQNNTWYDNINPGNSVHGTIVFDMPKGVTPATAELHDSLYSGGVKVSLQ